MPNLEELAAKYGGKPQQTQDLSALATKHGGRPASASGAKPPEPLAAEEIMQLVAPEASPGAGVSLEQLQAALVDAQARGDTETARRLAAFIEQAQQEPSNLIPGLPVTGTQVQPPEPTLGEQVIGAGETAAAMGTGATAGAVGYLGGALKGIAEEILSGRFGQGIAEREALQGAERFTYAPRTETGREMTAATGEALAPLQAVAPLAPELAVVGQAARAAAPLARAALRRTPQEPVTPYGVARPGGAAAVKPAEVRQAQAEELPVPIKLTKGQQERTFEQQRFERETAKLPEEGAKLRERFEEQNLQLQQNLDAFIDSTGAELADMRGIGEIVDKTLRQRAAKDKARIRTLYKEAEKAGELTKPVDMDPLAQYLNENRALRTEEGLLNKVQRQLDTLEVAQGSFQDGDLKLKPMTLNQVESVRRFINDNTNSNDAPEIRIATQLKGVIDATTKDEGGSKYKQARRARAKYAREYENIGLVKRLTGTKRGSDDRAIAMEDVLNKVVLSPSTSLDEMRHVRRLLQTKSGEQGKQAWREVQGGVLRHIRDEALKSVATNQRGDRVLSPAALDRIVGRLDRSGKLDFIFGKQGAEKIRVINDVAKDVATSPPGAVNNSNTASVLAGLMDVAVSGTAGVPIPVMTSFRLLTKSIKDAKLRARVKQALGE